MKDDIIDKSKSFLMDPTLPRWICQSYRHSLCVVVIDSYADKFFNESSSRSGMQASSVLGTRSVLGSSRMENSFVVLPKQKSPGPSFSSTTSKHYSSRFKSLRKDMEESFVVLPPAAASMYKCEIASEGNGTHFLPPPNSPSSPSLSNTPGFHSSITILKRAFEIATSQTQVDQPLCLECMRVLSDKLDKEVEDVNRDIKAYEACLQRLELESCEIFSEAEFADEKKKVEEEERRLFEAIEETEKQTAKVLARVQ